jgi:hypothetical protein
MIERRAFLRGLVAAPAVILTPGLLMPLRGIVMPVAKFDGNGVIIPKFDIRRGTIHISNPSDPDDWIDVGVVTELSFVTSR